MARKEDTDLKPDLDPGEYARILQGVRPIDVVLVSSTANSKLLAGVQIAPGSELTINLSGMDAKYELSESRTQFNFQTKMSISVKHGRGQICKIQAVIAVVFKSVVQVSDAFSEIFRDTSLPLIVGPYFREYFSSTLTRMGLPGIVLPLIIRQRDQDSVSDTGIP